jgi:hypothetical protein
MPIAKSVLREILQGMSEEEVMNLASNVAVGTIHEMVYFMQGQFSLGSFLSWSQTKMSYCSDISYNIESKNGMGKIQILFKHNLGEHWSLYNRVIVENILKEMLGGQAFEIEVSNTTLIIRFKWVLEYSY